LTDAVVIKAQCSPSPSLIP